VSFGVLALQGDFAAHAATLARLGLAAREVRRPAQLAGLDGIVIPGGESTTLLNLMGDEPWFEALRAFHASGGAILGTCAGVILLAREVRPRQPSLGLLDVVVERNAYGRQVDSFETQLELAGVGPLAGFFIRAPRILGTGPELEVLARHEGDPVVVRQGRVIGATFHPELVGATGLHALLVEATAAERVAAGG